VLFFQCCRKYSEREKNKEIVEKIGIETKKARLLVRSQAFQFSFYREAEE